MKRNEFERRVADLVQDYIDDYDRWGDNPQIRVNPSSLDATLVGREDFYTEIEDSDEAVENAAAAQGAATETASDFQVTQNPDFYAVRELIATGDDARAIPDRKAIARLADTYFD